MVTNDRPDARRKHCWCRPFTYNESMNRQKPSSDKIRSKHWLRILAVLLVLVVLAVPLILWLAGRFLVVSDDLQEADAVIALGGDNSFDRLERAVGVYQQGLARVLIIPDTPDATPTGQLYAVYMREAAIARGVRAEDIYVTEVTATSTWNEARAVRKLLLRNDWLSCIVVSDPYHTRRAKIAFNQDFREHGLSVQVTYTPQHWYRPSQWFLSARGVTTTLLEYVKLAGHLAGLENWEIN
jgi:uncharacterized SAM-binding protein YcdF (DUF218 family)